MDDELNNIVHGLGSVPLPALIEEIKKRFDVAIFYGIARTRSKEGNFAIDLKGEPWQVRGLIAELQDYIRRNTPTMPELSEDDEEDDED